MTLIAEWQSRGGAHGVALRRTGPGSYSFRARQAGGGFPAESDEAAIARMERPAWPGGPRKVDLYQPDTNKTPMKRMS